jgi:hypothetical protein
VWGSPGGAGKGEESRVMGQEGLTEGLLVDGEEEEEDTGAGDGFFAAPPRAAGLVRRAQWSCCSPDAGAQAETTQPAPADQVGRGESRRGRIRRRTGKIGPDEGGYPTYLFTLFFSSLLALKVGTFLAGISIRSPVFGLRATRCLRCRVRKLPKPRISMLSPARRGARRF